ncbi:MAG: hypothetical protein ABID79_04765, partial [Elusimicrobiota bacterium]
NLNSLQLKDYKDDSYGKVITETLTDDYGRDTETYRFTYEDTFGKELITPRREYAGEKSYNDTNSKVTGTYGYDAFYSEIKIADSGMDKKGINVGRKNIIIDANCNDELDDKELEAAAIEVAKALGVTKVVLTLEDGRVKAAIKDVIIYNPGALMSSLSIENTDGTVISISYNNSNGVEKANFQYKISLNLLSDSLKIVSDSLKSLSSKTLSNLPAGCEAAIDTFLTALDTFIGSTLTDAGGLIEYLTRILSDVRSIPTDFTAKIEGYESQITALLNGALATFNNSVNGLGDIAKEIFGDTITNVEKFLNGLKDGVAKMIENPSDGIRKLAVGLAKGVAGMSGSSEVFGRDFAKTAKDIELVNTIFGDFNREMDATKEGSLAWLKKNVVTDSKAANDADAIMKQKQTACNTAKSDLDAAQKELYTATLALGVSGDETTKDTAYGRFNKAEAALNAAQKELNAATLALSVELATKGTAEKEWGIQVSRLNAAKITDKNRQSDLDRNTAEISRLVAEIQGLEAAAKKCGGKKWCEKCGDRRKRIRSINNDELPRLTSDINLIKNNYSPPDKYSANIVLNSDAYKNAIEALKKANGDVANLNVKIDGLITVRDKAQSAKNTKNDELVAAVTKKSNALNNVGDSTKGKTLIFNNAKAALTVAEGVFDEAVKAYGISYEAYDKKYNEVIKSITDGLVKLSFSKKTNLTTFFITKGIETLWVGKNKTW